MLDLSRIDEKTGEVIEARPGCLFRSLTDLKQYKDEETYEPDTSLVDLTGYEPLSSIVARCMRYMKGPDGKLVSILDASLIKAEETQTGIYEAENAQSIDEAFETEDPTDAPGFDLADASEQFANAMASLSAVNENTKTEGPSDHDESRSGPSVAETEVREELANG